MAKKVVKIKIKHVKPKSLLSLTGIISLAVAIIIVESAFMFLKFDSRNTFLGRITSYTLAFMLAYFIHSFIWEK